MRMLKKLWMDIRADTPKIGRHIQWFASAFGIGNVILVFFPHLSSHVVSEILFGFSVMMYVFGAKQTSKSILDDIKE